MDTYTITLKRRFWFDKKLKKVKGNLFPQDMNINQIRYMLVIFEDERRLVVDLYRYSGYWLSKELFYINVKKAEEDSHGQARI